MKEKPILFSGAMVRAILEGRKTMTRRVVKGEALNWLDNAGFTPVFVADPENYLCPYGVPGDREWNAGLPPCEGWYYVEKEFDGKAVYLRPVPSGTYPDIEESVITWGWDERDDPEDLSSDGGPTPQTIRWKRCGDRLYVRETWLDDGETKDSPQWIYRADNENYPRHEGQNWKPSIFMPRAASRILLEVTDVRVERLQEIGEADAKAEGVEPDVDAGYWKGYIFPGVYDSAKKSFASLWQSINGLGSWDQNPWVWVVSFKRIEP